MGHWDYGNVRKVMVPTKFKKWWILLPDGKLQIAVYWKSKQLEFEDGKNAIEIESTVELIPTLERIKKSIDLGDFDIFIS